MRLVIANLCRMQSLLNLNNHIETLGVDTDIVFN